MAMNKTIDDMVIKQKQRQQVDTTEKSILQLVQEMIAAAKASGRPVAEMMEVWALIQQARAQNSLKALAMKSKAAGKPAVQPFGKYVLGQRVKQTPAEIILDAARMDEARVAMGIPDFTWAMMLRIFPMSD